MARPTPGPWRIDQYGAVLGPDSRTIEANGLAMVCSPGERQNIARANSQLIAAAPEMLQALEAAVECGIVPTSSTRDGGANAHLRQVQVADMIRAAIAKAFGK